jgi:hypothetical protein
MSKVLEILWMIITCTCCVEDDMFIRHTQLENKFYEEYPRESMRKYD